MESELELPLKQFYKTNNLLQKYSVKLFNFNIYFIRWLSTGSITPVKKRFYSIEVLKCFILSKSAASVYLLFDGNLVMSIIFFSIL